MNITIRVCATFPLAMLLFMHAPLVANHQRPNPCTRLRNACIVGVALLGGRTVYNRQTAQESPLLPSIVGKSITTIIDARSGNPIENVTGFIESFKAKHGPSACTLTPHTLQETQETLQLTCHPLGETTQNIIKAIHKR